jgi:hypothetical protein
MDWDSPRTPVRGRLARLIRELDDVADQAREAAAGAVGGSVAGAVAEAVLAARSLAGRRDRPSQQPFRSYPESLASSRESDGLGWGRDDRRGWHDPYEPDEDDPGYDGEPGPEEGVRRGRSHPALALGLRAAAWWLDRPGRASLPAALAVGVIAALAGHALFLRDEDDEDSTNPQRRS